ncbi:MAG: EAL domain-containing protein [Erythrobacter sp.]|nr:EAL domain-containing protein [Erythrobacter sp.]
MLAGLIHLALPAEDALRALRAELRTSEASGDVILIEVDEETLVDLGVDQPSRYQDAELVEKVFEMGLERLAFDRAYADSAEPAEDAAFAAALEKHRGRVWLGAFPPVDKTIQQHDGLFPADTLRDSVEVAAMIGEGTPFGLSVLFPVSIEHDGETIPAISAVLAGFEGAGGWYRPDFAFDTKAIPTVRYSDILNGEVEEQQLRGKVALVAATHLGSRDFHYLPLGGKIPGAYFHILGAETLKQGMPTDLGWYPAMLVAALLLALQASRKRPSAGATASCALFLAIIPLALEMAYINVDVMPAILALAIGTWRLSHLANTVYSRSTNLMVPQAIEAKQDGSAFDVYALRINNLADFTHSSAPRELGAFIERILKCLRTQSDVCPKEGLTAFDKDTIVWTSARTDPSELRDTALAISTLLANFGASDALEGKLEVSISIDVNYELRLEQRIQNASQAAEMASRRGLRVLISDQNFLEDRGRRVTMLTALDRALGNDGISLVYQPKVDLVTGHTVGAEALVRWTNDTLGTVNPQELIAIAEEHGRIDALTEYVFERALAEMKQAIVIDERFKLSINISAQSLTEAAFVGSVLHLCEKHRFPARNLVLEITETQKLDDQRVEANIKRLHDAGLRFSIDDFGTGHSSLDYLQRFPSCELKIDKKFVMNLRTSSDSRTLIRATIEMAHAMGKIVVAEGVDNELTCAELKRMQCDLAQGYLFSRALPVADFIPHMKRRSAAA